MNETNWKIIAEFIGSLLREVEFYRNDSIKLCKIASEIVGERNEIIEKYLTPEQKKGVMEKIKSRARERLSQHNHGITEVEKTV